VLNVDRSNPQLYAFSFTAAQADPAATTKLGSELGYLDTRVAPVGTLVVYLHGAGAPGTCGSTAHGTFLAGRGFHVVSPCYEADYGVGACGTDIGGCRLEAFEGVDHTSVIAVTPPNSIETRVVKMLQRLQTLNPKGDWRYFLDGARPRWSHIIISGISHGASSAALIAKVRSVVRSVSLSGPLDTNQAWLSWTSATPAERYYGFTHTADPQHSGHLAAFQTMGLPGAITTVDGAAPPYGNSHRLRTSATTTDGHGSTQAGGVSPKNGNLYVFAPVWQYAYGN
jgi:hypothetical protein